MKFDKFVNKDAIKYFSLFTGIALTIIFYVFFAIVIYKCFEKYFFKSLSVLFILILVAIISAFYSIYVFIVKNINK